MGNTHEVKICCKKVLCTPQYEITFQDLDCKSQASPSPTLRQEYLKSNFPEADSQLSSQDTSRLHHLEQLSLSGKKLKIRIIASSSLKANTEYNLLPLGYKQGLRGAKDGFCYFGAKKYQYIAGKKTIVNDIILPIDPNLVEQHRGQHFCIYYDVTQDCYMLKDMFLGFGTFFKVRNQLYVKNDLLVFIGEHYLLFNLLSQSEIKVKIFGKNQGEFRFSAEDFKETLVKIGRCENCEVVIQDYLASKVHCFLRFVEKWELVDGDGEKISTNGVWVYINEPLEIGDGMYYKANHTIFQTSLYK